MKRLSRRRKGDANARPALRLLFDAALSPESAEFARRQGADALHVRDLGMLRASDEQVLDRAAEDRRTLVTLDLDFPRILALAHAITSPGVVLFRFRPATRAAVNQAITRVLKLTPKSFENAVVVVESDRIRVRPLPLVSNE